MITNQSDTLRGHPIYFDGVKYRFADTNEPTSSTWKSRSCGHCGLDNTPEGYDGCLSTGIPGAVNACCGHGQDRDAYIQFSNGDEIRGQEAIRFIRQINKVAK
jgi:hypothetical protein